MGRTSKEKVMIYILSKLQYIFTQYLILRSGNVTADCPQTCRVFIPLFKNGDFHVALRFRQGNGGSLQTGMGFVIVSHDITTDGASRGFEPNPL